MTLPEDILRAMGRLASRGEVDVSPSRIADLIGEDGPRPSLGAMWQAIYVLEDAQKITDGRIGLDRFRLAPAPYVPDSEQMGMEV